MPRTRGDFERYAVANFKIALVLDVALMDKNRGMVGKIFCEVPPPLAAELNDSLVDIRHHPLILVLLIREINGRRRAFLKM
jgi:hypothetical protein